MTGTVNGDALSYTLATASQFSNVGNHPITVTLGNNPNYNVTPIDGTLQSPRARRRCRPTTNRRPTGMQSRVDRHDHRNRQRRRVELFAGDTGDAVLQHRSYAITVMLGSNSNYNVTATNGMLDIDPKAATVTADNKSRTYGDPNPSLTATVGGQFRAATSSTTRSPPGRTSLERWRLRDHRDAWRESELHRNAG